MKQDRNDKRDKKNEENKKKAFEDIEDWRQRLVFENLNLLMAVAKSFPYIPPIVDIEELANEGLSGLLAAAKRCDYKKIRKFKKYACKYIKGSINNYLHNILGIKKIQVKNKKELEEEILYLENKLVYLKDKEKIEYIKEMIIIKNEDLKLLLSKKFKSNTSIDDYENKMKNEIQDPSENQEQLLIFKTENPVIESAKLDCIATLTIKNRIVIHMRRLGCCFDEISCILKKKYTTVYYRYKRSLESLYKCMTQRGVFYEL